MFQLLSRPPEPKPVPSGAFNELIHLVGQYRKRSGYAELLQFMVRFRMYSHYNAWLIRNQKPGAKYVATAKRWEDQYRRKIKPGGQAIVILKPKGPVMFVFDVSDTEPMQNATELPKDMEMPFAVGGSFDSRLLTHITVNAARDGVEVVRTAFGSQQGGRIETVEEGQFVTFVHGFLFKKKVELPRRYVVQVSDSLSESGQYALMVHELAHLYCGHLGSADTLAWPDRRGRSLAARECEAESVAYLVCRSLGIETRSDAYLAGYLGSDAEIPEEVDADLILRVVSLIQEMSCKALGPRKDKLKRKAGFPSGE